MKMSKTCMVNHFIFPCSRKSTLWHNGGIFMAEVKTPHGDIRWNFILVKAKTPLNGHHVDFLCQKHKFHLMATIWILCVKVQNSTQWPPCRFMCQIPLNGHHVDLCAKGQNFAKWPSHGFFLLQKQNFDIYYIGFMVYVYVLGFRVYNSSPRCYCHCGNKWMI